MHEKDKMLYSEPENKGGGQFTPKGGFRAWVKTLWPLVLHCILSIATTIMVIRYINERHFNLTERRPSVPLADGTTIQSNQYSLLQSDVTTVLSATLVVLRVILAAWAGALCWRSAFLLMEKPGLRRRDLDWMLSFGVFTPLSYFKDALILFVGMILLATLLAGAVSPILTGSIAWTPSNRRVEAQGATMQVTGIENSGPWYGYSNYPPRRQYTTIQAAGTVAIAWGREHEKGVLKRVLPSATGLNVNSTISSVTLPYFSVTGLEWIADPMTLSEDQRNTSLFAPKLRTQGTANPLMMDIGTAALIPDAAWSQRPFPEPSVVSETRLLVLYTTWDPKPSCQLNNSDISLSLPPSMGLYYFESTCLAFARVTYSAGVAECANCRISSPLTVQNDTALDLRADPMTTEALSLMPETIAALVLMNSSIPSTWGNIDDYVVDLLSRSYSGAWTALTNYLSQESAPLNLTFSASVPSLQARVDMVRVFAWLGIQLIATLCGILFLLKQAGSDYRLIGETTFAALQLDASEATGMNGDETEDNDRLRLRPRSRGGLELFVE